MNIRFSPVVRADVRFSGDPEWLHVNVWFRDRVEIQSLIDALTELRDTVGEDYDHLHLQHYGLAPGHAVGLAEVNFFRPGRGPNDSEVELAETAAEWISEADHNTT